MVNPQNRKHRGYRTQKDVAEWFREHGWPYATAVGAGEGGDDVRNVPFHAEVKARRNLNLLDAIRQSKAHADDGAPYIVIARPDGYGPAKIGQWLAFTDLETITRLLKERECRCS